MPAIPELIELDESLRRLGHELRNPNVDPVAVADQLRPVIDYFSGDVFTREAQDRQQQLDGLTTDSDAAREGRWLLRIIDSIPSLLDEAGMNRSVLGLGQGPLEADALAVFRAFETLVLLETGVPPRVAVDAVRRLPTRPMMMRQSGPAGTFFYGPDVSRRIDEWPESIRNMTQAAFLQLSLESVTKSLRAAVSSISGRIIVEIIFQADGTIQHSRLANVSQILAEVRAAWDFARIKLP